MAVWFASKMEFHVAGVLRDNASVACDGFAGLHELGNRLKRLILL